MMKMDDLIFYNGVNPADCEILDGADNYRTVTFNSDMFDRGIIAYWIENGHYVIVLAA